MVEAEFFDKGEIVFDFIEVGGIGWQEEDLVGRGSGKRAEIVFVMERRIIPDDRGLDPQDREQLGFKPVVDEGGIGRAFKQDGRQEGLAPPGGNQTGARPSFAPPVAVSLPAPAPATRTVRVRRKPRFVHIDNIPRAALRHDAAQAAEIGDALLRVSLGVAQRFFYA